MFNFTAFWFKASGDGWVFRPPASWQFGDERNYLLTQGQKDRVQALMMRGLLAITCLVFVTSIPLFFSAKHVFQYSHAMTPAVFAAALIFVVLAGSVMVVSLMVGDRLFHGLWLGAQAKAILKGAARTNLAFTALEAQAQYDRQQSAFGRVSAFLCPILGLSFFVSPMVNSDVPLKQIAAVVVGLCIPFIIIAAIKLIVMKRAANT